MISDDGRKCRWRRKHIIEERRNSEGNFEKARQKKRSIGVKKKKKRSLRQRKKTHLTKGNIERKLNMAKVMNNDKYDVITKALFPGQSYHCPGFPGSLDCAIFRTVKILFQYLYMLLDGYPGKDLSQQRLSEMPIY